ncbi:MAG: hypothetical protein K2M91_01735 [Lachnospiraceae bacterium]|nr:hypothetical protein [Lachnospiraceae bacterium]
MVRKIFMITLYSHAIGFGKYSIELGGQPRNKNCSSPIVCTQYRDDICGEIKGNFCNICDKASVMQFVNKRLKSIGLQNAGISYEQFDFTVNIQQGNCTFQVLVRYYWDYRIDAVEFEYFTVAPREFFIGKGYVNANIRSYKAVIDHFRNYMLGLDIVSISQSPRQIR